MAERLDLHSPPLRNAHRPDWWATVTDEEVATVSVDRWNAWCAVGLPGSEQLDRGQLARTLDDWAELVAWATRHHVHQLHDSPDVFGHSHARWCCYCILWCAQTRLRAVYNADWRGAIFLDDSRKSFLHGIVPGPGRDAPGGTCATMPVLYVALGRRLGYPLKLVRSFDHVWFRWDDPHGHHGPPEVFNVEGSTDGYAFEDDAYYRERQDVQPAEERNGWYMQSLTPREEVGSFLLERGYVLERVGRIPEAHEAFSVALRLWAPGGRMHAEIRHCWLYTGALLGRPLVPEDAAAVHEWVLATCRRMGWAFVQEQRPADVDAYFPPLGDQPLWIDENGDEAASRRCYERTREHHRRHGLKVTVYHLPVFGNRAPVPEGANVQPIEQLNA